MSTEQDSRRKSVLKAISWRITGTIDTIVIAWLVTGTAKHAVAIGGFELVTKTILYYLHERAWITLPARFAPKNKEIKA